MVHGVGGYKRRPHYPPILVLRYNYGLVLYLALHPTMLGTCE